MWPRHVSGHAARDHDAEGVGTAFKWIHCTIRLVYAVFFYMRVHRNIELEMLTIWVYPLAPSPSTPSPSTRSPSDAFLFTVAWSNVIICLCFDWNRMEQISISQCWWPGAHPRGEAAGMQPPQTPQNRHLKNTDFVDVMISNVLCDFPFSRNRPLKSADD
jgi:hypothetical protein